MQMNYTGAMRKHAVRTLLMAGAGLAAIVPAAAAFAQGKTAADANVGNDEIIVTAQRRAENIQNVPVAITSLSGDKLASSGITGTTDLKELTPGLQFNTNLGGFGQPRVRGIGTTATGPGLENPVATYVDGVYTVSPTGAIFELGDVQQVDVLKGPQGTLFGRNATGGVIQVTTRQPGQELHADFKANYGNYNTWGGSGYVSGGLAPTLTASISGLYSRQEDGYGRNLATGLDVQKGWNYALRGKLVWQPGPATKITLAGDYADLYRSDPAIRTYQGLTTAGTPTAGGAYDINLNVQPYLSTKQGGAMLSIQQDFDSVQLLSISAYRDAKLHTRFDGDQTPAPLLALDLPYHDRQFSQEVQLLSTNSGPFKWVIGAYYMWSKGTIDNQTVSGPQACGFRCATSSILGNVSATLNTYAGFAQGTYAIGPSTNFTVGIRYTSDKRDLVQSNVITTVPFFGATTVVTVPDAAAKTFPKATWRLALDHRFSPELMGYISYNRGFKSGTFQSSIIPAKVLEPEVVDAFEAGFKADLLDSKLRLNVSGFYYDYKNSQANQIIFGSLFVYNAPGTINYGLDADLQTRFTPNFTVNAGASWLHARYKNGFNTPFWSVPIPNAFSNALGFGQVGGNSVIQCPTTNGLQAAVFTPCNASGNHLQNTPDYTFNIGFNYDIPSAVGKFSLAGNYYYNGGYFDDPQNRLHQSAYGLLNASLGWTSSSERFNAQFWVKNMTDQFYTQQQNALDVGDNRVAAPPRTFGITLGVHY